MAKGYLVANMTVTDPDRYAEYRKQVLAVIERHGGRFIVRGGMLDKREGESDFERLVVVEFPSLDAAQAFYESPEYKPLIALRQGASRGRLVLVEGV